MTEPAQRYEVRNRNLIFTNDLEPIDGFKLVVLHSDYARLEAEVVELRARVEQLSGPGTEEGNWLIHFDDPDRADEIFTGLGAAHAAMERYWTCSYSWTCHLFCEYSARAQAKPDAAPPSNYYIAAPFQPWWDETKTGPAPSCGCGAMMVRPKPRGKPEGWTCLSCGHYKPDAAKEEKHG